MMTDTRLLYQVVGGAYCCHLIVSVTFYFFDLLPYVRVNTRLLAQAQVLIHLFSFDFLTAFENFKSVSLSRKKTKNRFRKLNKQINTD